MTFSIVILWINVVAFGLYGIAFIFKPMAMSQACTGTAPNTTSAVTDMRATYGGFMLSVGLWIGWVTCTQAANQALIQAALILVVMVMVCMAVTRTLGMLVDGSSNGYIKIALAAEVIVAALAIAALKSVISQSLIVQ